VSSEAGLGVPEPDDVAVDPGDSASMRGDASAMVMARSLSLAAGFECRTDPERNVSSPARAVSFSPNKRVGACH